MTPTTPPKPWQGPRELMEKGSPVFCIPHHAESLPTCLLPTGCRPFTLEITMEMLLGSASVVAYQDRPGLSCAILSPTGSDLGMRGGATEKINQAQFQQRQRGHSREMLRGFPLIKTLKSVATTARLNQVGSTLGGACTWPFPDPKLWLLSWLFL